MMTVDYQTLFNLAFFAVSFLGGYLFNNVGKALDRLDQDVRQMPVNYVAKVDYQRDIDDLKSMTRAIYDKLDGKADK